MSEGKYNKEVVDVISQIALKLIKGNPALAPLVSAIAEKLVNDWSSGSTVRKALAYPVKKCLLCEGISNEPAAKTSVAADLGRLITLLAASANKEGEMNPDGNGSARGEAARDFLAKADFGEVLEFLEKSEDGVQKSMDAFNEALWTYPTKFGNIMSMLTSLFRISVKGANEVIAPIKRDIGPDLLGDIVCTLIRDIKPEEMAKLADSVGELVRRVHTGSQIVGQGDKSKLEVYLDDLMTDYHRAKDVYLQKMLPVYIGEIRESIAKASARSLKNHEELFLAQIASLGPAKTLDLKVKAARLSVFEAVDTEKFGDVMTDTMKEFDTFEAAELVNSVCRILNKLQDIKPDLIGSVLTGIIDSISADEVKRTASWLIPEIVDSIKPLVQELKPELLRGLAELVRSNGYSNYDDEEAMNELKAALGSAGGVQ